MNYNISQIRKSLLKLKDKDPKGFFIEIKKNAEIVFHREGNDIVIRNKNNMTHGELHFNRENLVKGLNDDENDYLFAIFLEDVKKNHLKEIGISS